MRPSTLFSVFVALLVSFAAVSPAMAQGRVDVLEELVPPPKLLLRFQDQLGLTAAQKKQLKQVIKDAQAASLDLEFKVQEEAGKLAELIGADAVDVPKALKQADKLMAAESALKRVKLEMMLRTKALLTKEQLVKIEEVKAKHRDERRERRQRRLGQ